jgi:hypothetical protein
MPNQNQGTATSGFGVIPDEITGILFSVMAEKYYKALESGSRRGLTNDEWIVLTSLRNNYGTFNFASPAFKAMLEPLSTMNVNEIADELNSRQRVIPPFGTPEYSEYRRLNPPGSPVPSSPPTPTTPPSTSTTTTTTVPPTTTTAATTAATNATTAATNAATRTYSSGAGDIEPGEMSRPGMGAVSGAAPTQVGPPSGTSSGYGAAELGAVGAGPAAGPGQYTTGASTTTTTGTTATVTGGGGGVVIEEPATETGLEDIPETWQEAAAALYPEYWAIIQTIPEIAKLLKQAYDEQWEVGGAKFQAALEATNWWKTTTAAARLWDINSSRDPATYQSYVDQRAEEINQQALNLGIRLSESQLQKLSLDSLRQGWEGNSQLITNAIGMVATTSGSQGATQLREGYYGQSVRQIANNYGVSIADETFNSFVNKIAVGTETLDSFQDYALNIAKALYPALREQFDAGRSFADAVSPYREIAAATLELNPNDIDFMDPLWATPITYMPDPSTGEQRLMNLREWGQELRTNKAYGYEFTNQARENAYKITSDLANLFGRL